MKNQEIKKIETLLKDWVESTRHDRKDNILSNHLPDAIIFDVLAPLQYQGAKAYRESFDEWQPPFEIPSLFELNELRITVGDKTGFAHCLINCGGTLPDGKEVRDTVRATFCFIKTEDSWQVAHHHISMPTKLG
ncbi:YybH family protein [Microbulbifer variabilis]|uniref:YybH family protein n=1 Tax=Microbulbifer variabilis TaxID=266805 RepID=UPI001CFCBA2D|nr:nuclear transport factor 2 family protein [Microbulbifer variabilis]